MRSVSAAETLILGLWFSASDLPEECGLNWNLSLRDNWQSCKSSLMYYYSESWKDLNAVKIMDYGFWLSKVRKNFVRAGLEAVCVRGYLHFACLHSWTWLFSIEMDCSEEMEKKNEIFERKLLPLLFHFFERLQPLRLDQVICIVTIGRKQTLKVRGLNVEVFLVFNLALFPPRLTS